MSKLFSTLIAAVAALGFSAPAQANLSDTIISFQTNFMMEAEATAGLNWVVGDKASFKMSGGFINGKIDAFVRQDTGTSFWLQQDADLGFLGKQKIEILLNKSTGQIEKMLVNGQEQNVPEPNVEIVEMKQDRVRVSAGEFDCIYVKVKDKGNGQIQEAWVNPQKVPMSGQIKSVSDSQFGKITQELTSFQFAPRP
jgi:hypothetical protein